MTDTSWQELMFKDFADPFVEILRAKTLPETFDGFIAALSPDKECRRLAVDLGSGIGRTAAALARRYDQVIAVDYSQALVDVGRATLSDQSNVELVCADFWDLETVLDRRRADLFLRAYTSLGYFARDREVALLQRFRRLAASGAIYIGDTFNFAWIATAGQQARTTSLPGFTLHEIYESDRVHRCIKAKWTYHYPDRRIEIPFELDGYSVPDIQAMATTAGWSLHNVYSDFRLDAAFHDTAERIVYVLKA